MGTRAIDAQLVRMLYRPKWLVAGGPNGWSRRPHLGFRALDFGAPDERGRAEKKTLFKRCTQLSVVPAMWYSHRPWAMKPSTCASTSALSDAKGASLAKGANLKVRKIPVLSADKKSPPAKHARLLAAAAS